MARVYTVQFNGVVASGAAQKDFFEITAAAGKNCEIAAVLLSNLTEIGDAMEESLLLKFKTGMTTSGSGGSAPTPVPTSVTTTAAGFSAEVNNTTKSSGGTIVTHHSENWNVRSPYLWLPPEDMRIQLTGGRRFAVELATNPADDITMAGTLYVIEHG